MTAKAKRKATAKTAAAAAPEAEDQPKLPRNKWTAFFAQLMGILLDGKAQVIPEYELYKDPMRIDIVVIKLLKDEVIDNTVMRFFREHNIVEFKGPSDTLNIWSFNRVLSYFYSYLTQERVGFDDAAITFVSVRRPVKLFRVLQEERGYKITPSGTDGIYYITIDGQQAGHIPAMQLVVNCELSAADAEWIKAIRNDWTAEYGEEAIHKAEKIKDSRMRELIYSLALANQSNWKEDVMTNLISARDFRRFAELSGLAAKWEQRGWQAGAQEGWQKGRQEGRQEGAQKTARQLLKFLKSGHSLEEAEKKFAMA